jgi:hypothetical protein
VDESPSSPREIAFDASIVDKRTRSGPSSALAILGLTIPAARHRDWQKTPTASIKLCKRDNLHFYTAGSNAKHCHSHQQAEAPRTGASWVDEKHLATLPNSGFVRVARGDGCESRGCRIEVELREVMKDVELLVGDLNDVAYRKLG